MFCRFAREKEQLTDLILNHLILKVAQHVGVVGLMNSLQTGHNVTRSGDLSEAGVSKTRLAQASKCKESFLYLFSLIV